MSKKKNKTEDPNMHPTPKESVNTDRDHTDSHGEGIDHGKQMMEDTKNAAGQSETHKNSMSEQHGDEKRPEKGWNKLTEENENALPPVAEMTSGKTDHNAAGESKSKIDRETSTELPH